jgi:SAM-dependent methyltransferase
MHPEKPHSTATQRPSGEWLAAHVGLLLPGLRVLDLGCGWGNDAVELHNLGLAVVGMDRSRDNLERARQVAPGVPLVQADMTQRLPFRAAAFDVVVASLCLHYFPWETTRRVVHDVADLIRPEGWLLCRVNRVGDVSFDYGVGIEHEPEFFEVEPGHFKRFFTEETLAELLCDAYRIDVITRETTTRFGAPKQTLVARAQRRGV